MVSLQIPLSPSKAQDIVRQAALSYFPREKVAVLSGDDWLTFLDAQLASRYSPQRIAMATSALPRCSPNERRTEKAQQQLVNDCETWLRRYSFLQSEVVMTGSLSDLLNIEFVCGGCCS